jgi:hypothetical protein
MATAFEVCEDDFSHSKETSSSVGPMPLGFSGDSENGSSEAIRLAGLTPLLLLGPGIGKKRLGSMGDCPCLEVMMISVESSRPLLRSSFTHSPMAASTN